jgi:hypothetical protein
MVERGCGRIRKALRRPVILMDQKREAVYSSGEEGNQLHRLLKKQKALLRMGLNRAVSVKGSTDG